MSSILLRLTLLLATCLIKHIKPEHVRWVGDWLLDMVEDMAANSTNKVDDAVVFPLAEKVREAYHIPNND